MDIEIYVLDERDKDTALLMLKELKSWGILKLLISTEKEYYEKQEEELVLSNTKIKINELWKYKSDSSEMEDDIEIIMRQENIKIVYNFFESHYNIQIIGKTNIV